MSRGKLSIRSKLLLAFMALGCIGSAAGLSALLRMRRLETVLHAEERDMAVHERVSDFRRGLLHLVVVTQGALLQPRAGFRDEIAAQLHTLDEEGARCDACHEAAGGTREVRPRLDQLSAKARHLLDADLQAGGQAWTGRYGDAPEAAALVGELATTANDIGRSLWKMDERHSQRLRLHRATEEEIFHSSSRQVILLLVGAFALATAIAVGLAHSMSRPISRLIDGARRVGAGDLGHKVPVPRDPDLAELTRQFNGMASRVAERVTESTRQLLLDRVLSSQEDERRRVARELHDQIGQSLLALLLTVRTAPGHPEAIEAGLRGLVDEVRRMAWDLRPSILGDLGLEAALARFCEEAAVRTKIPVDFQSASRTAPGPRAPESVELVVYRVAQEAIRNALTHAQASRVSVVLFSRAEHVTLLVEDDGVGFDTAKIFENGVACLGLVGMQERAALAGGDLAITSAPTKGTSIQARIPIVQGGACV